MDATYPGRTTAARQRKLASFAVGQAKRMVSAVVPACPHMEYMGFWRLGGASTLSWP